MLTINTSICATSSPTGCEIPTTPLPRSSPSSPSTFDFFYQTEFYNQIKRKSLHQPYHQVDKHIFLGSLISPIPPTHPKLNIHPSTSTSTPSTPSSPVDRLLKHNIKYIISFVSYHPMLKQQIQKAGIRLIEFHVSAQEFHDSIHLYLEAILNQIYKVDQQKKQNILIHCRTGIDISLSIVCAYLMAKYKQTWATTFHYIRSIRHCVDAKFEKCIEGAFEYIKQQKTQPK